jgi:hypothetical protein
MKKKYKPLLAWMAVAICTVSIFFTVTIARAIQNFVSETWSRSLFGYAVLFCTAAALFSTFYIFIFKLKIRSALNYIVLAATAGAYTYFTLQLWETPEEAIHFLEYGLLGFLLFSALKFRTKDKFISISAFLIGCLIGTFDEILQWAVPDRYWDFRDVGLNALSSGLFQFALALGIRPPIISQKVRFRSVKKASALLAANIILLGLCFSNTPARVSSYTRTFPFLSFLLREEAMNQFNKKHEDPEIGVFYSRLTIPNLLREDSERASEYGQILAEWEDRDYAEFLRNYTGIWAPFLHEMRVHVYRRDKRFERALQSEDDNIRDRDLFIAYKENLILEKYFGNTLKESPYLWDEKTRLSAEDSVDTTAPYRSPVSATLFSPKSEKDLWIGILFFLALLLTVNGLLSRWIA